MMRLLDGSLPARSTGQRTLMDMHKTEDAKREGAPVPSSPSVAEGPSGDGTHAHAHVAPRAVAATATATVTPAAGEVKDEGGKEEGGKEPRGGARKKTQQNNVRKIRTEKMMSKAELARRAGMSTLTIDRVERGMPCRMDTKRKILEALGLKPSDRVLVFGEDD
jgi:DNA-binding XRE family transcriptional regulator